MTPHHSQASIIFGKGIRSAKPGLADSLVLAVNEEMERHSPKVHVASKGERPHLAFASLTAAARSPRGP